MAAAADIFFPLHCEEYTLNTTRYIKFTHLQTNLHGFAKYADIGYFILLINDKKLLVYKHINNIYNYCYAYHNNIAYFINQNNVKSQIPNSKLNIDNLFLLMNTYDKDKLLRHTQRLNQNNIFICKINKIEIDLTRIHQYIEELNKILYLRCMNKYKIDINYAYKMNNVLFYSQEEPSSLIMCVRIGEECVSSIELVLEDNEDLTYNIKIDSQTLKEYEGNKFNQILRLIIMIISQFFPIRISHIHSQAVNPISAYLMIKLFRNNEFDETFTQYIIKRDIGEINYDVIDKYINSANYMQTDTESDDEDTDNEDTDNEINIFSPANEINIRESYTKLYDLIKNLPCEIHYEEILRHLDPKFVPQHFTQEELQHYLQQPQIGGYVLRKCKKYNDKLKHKFLDTYIDKLLFWNTIYLIHKH